LRVAILLQFRLLHVRLHLFGGRLLRQLLRFELNSQIIQVGLRRFDLPFQVRRVQLHLRLAQDHDHVVRMHSRARQEIDLVDAALKLRRNPHVLLHHQRSQTSYVAHHWAALHRVNPHRRPIDGGRRGFEPRKSPSDEWNCRHKKNNVDDPANQFSACDFFAAWYIHCHGRFLLMLVRKYAANVDITEK
jgi:hypothetical protein